MSTFAQKLRKLHNYFVYLKNKKHRINGYEYEDTAILHAWTKRDYNIVLQEAELIRAKILPANAIWNKLLRIWNDQRAGTFFHKGFRFDPEQISKAGDLIVNGGLVHFAKLHVGQLSSPPDHAGIGLGTANPSPSDYQLGAEAESRLNLLQSGGFRELIGMDEHYGAFWPFNIADNNFTETGLFWGKSAETGQTLIARNRYNPAIEHHTNANGVGMNIIIKHRAYT